MAKPGPTRRDFVQHAAGAAGLGHIVPCHMLGRGYRAPSDTLTTGTITNVKLPEEWLKPVYRRGWTL
jgi:hypothetical protein